MVGLSRKRVFPKTKRDSITGQDRAQKHCDFRFSQIEKNLKSQFCNYIETRLGSQSAPAVSPVALFRIHLSSDTSSFFSSVVFKVDFSSLLFVSMVCTLILTKLISDCSCFRHCFRHCLHGMKKPEDNQTINGYS